MAEVLIRQMHKTDIERVLEIYCQGLETGIATFQTMCPSQSEWEEGHLPNCRFVAEIDGIAVGWVALSPTSKRDVYSGVVEVSLYIAEEARGQGVGARLMQKLVEESEKAGYWSLYSSIFEENEASQAIHKKCGFRKVGFREKIAKDKYGMWHNTVIFERRSPTIYE